MHILRRGVILRDFSPEGSRADWHGPGVHIRSTLDPLQAQDDAFWVRGKTPTSSVPDDVRYRKREGKLREVWDLR